MTNYIAVKLYLAQIQTSTTPIMFSTNTGDIFKCIFLNENIWISINISLKFVPKCRINNIPASF